MFEGGKVRKETMKMEFFWSKPGLNSGVIVLQLPLAVPVLTTAWLGE